jgi:hypothetical protein
LIDPTMQEILNAQTFDSEHRTDKDEHGYIPIYEELFTPFRDTVLPILEIGIWAGSSLQLWRDWFYRAVIHGIDARECDDLGERIVTHQGFTLDPEFLPTVAACGPFQIVIDDGAHMGDDQRIAFRAFWPALAPGGLYIIEDLHASYMEYYAPSGLPFMKMLVDSLTVKGEYEDIRRITFYPKLFVAEKR